MKTIFIIICIAVTGIACAQNTTINTTNAPVNNSSNVLNSNFSASNSGVNPAGNPGTIISSSLSNLQLKPSLPSNPVNNTIKSLKNPPPASVNSTVYGYPVNSNNMVYGYPVNNGTVTIISGNAEANPVSSVNTITVSNDVVSSNSPVNSNNALKEPLKEPLTANESKVVSVNVPSSTTVVVNHPATVNPGLTSINSIPVLSTYVPPNIITALKEKYGDRLYSITRVKGEIASGQYIVRLQDNGVYSAIVYTEGK